MFRLRRILVPIRDLQRTAHPAAIKAAQLAAGSGAEIELYHAYDTPNDVFTIGTWALTPSALEQQEHARARRRLETIARSLRRLGARVTTMVSSDFPAYEAIIRRALHIRADLVVVDARGRHRGASLLRLTDWELLRHSPVPVLLVKKPRRYDGPVVLAALDPQHHLAKPTQLERIILEAASGLQQVLRGELHALHAYAPMPLAVASGDLDASFATQVQQDTERRAREGFERTLRGTDIPARRRHLVPEHALSAIPEVARTTRADIAVLGAISRSGLKRLLIGNTAEAVLDELPCDLLVVKPRGFDSKVRDRPRGLNWKVLSSFAPAA